MYNPFPLLNPRLLQDKIAEGKRYFVRQTYPRGLMRGFMASFLFRAYDAAESGQAETHLQMILHDRHAFLYDTENPAHIEKLRIAAGQPFGYRIYYAGKKGVDWKPPPVYREKMKHYIRKNHPGWKKGPTSEQVLIGLFEEYGQLFLKFNFQKEEDKILFEEIEKY